MDYMVWVGKQFYKTPQEYIEEADRLGCCRKVNILPRELEVGKTRIWLVHKDGGEPVAFGYFLLDGIISCSRQQEITDYVRQGYPITAIGAQAREHMPRRGCGDIDPPSVYVVGPRDITAEMGFRQPGTNETRKIVVLPQPIKLQLKHFRGILPAPSCLSGLRVAP